VTRDHEGLLIDVGGVLTTDIFPSFDAYCAREGLTVGSFRELYFGSPAMKDVLHRLELGELDATEAQPEIARLLGLPPEREEGLFPGLYQEVHFVPAMTEAVESLRRSGVRTGVLSNSWWFPMYEKPFYDRAFDVQLISGKVGLRKPQKAMFERGIEALGIAPERIVFVDDFEENLPPAESLGLTTVLHDPDDPARTIAALERLFDVRLAPA
jgi:putative hydrolase of the HAD superfamily